MRKAWLSEFQRGVLTKHNNLELVQCNVLFNSQMAINTRHVSLATCTYYIKNNTKA